jgi:hypothetical protein
MAIKINGTNTTASPGITGPDTDTGLVYGTDEVQVVTGGTTRATVDSSGNVGIGTSSPSHNLTIKGSTPGLAFVPAADSQTMQIAFRQSADSATRGAIRYDLNTNALAFDANSSERARIDSSGDLHIGNTVSSAHTNRLLSVGDTSKSAAFIEVRTSTSGDGGVLFSDGTDGTNSGYRGSVEYNHTSDYMFMRTAGSVRMSLDSSGYLYVPSMPVGGAANLHWSSGNGQFFVSSSSERFKHNISDYDKGLAELKRLQPKYFTYNDEPAQKQRAGFIAEDFHSLGLTEYVEYWNDDDGNATVPSEINYPNMVAILVKSLQEATTRIETLETQNASLEARLIALEGGAS